jgi:HAD superfamily hydrolase (TIGR01509 family)
MVKGIIFDFDGVIVDSEVSYVDSVVEYLNRLGIKTTFDDVKYVVGQNMNDIASDLIKQFNLNISNQKVIDDSMKVYNEVVDIYKIPTINGVIDFIKKCHNKNIKMCIASSSEYSYLYAILNNLNITDYFEFVLSGADFVHSKPDPEIYNIAAQKLNIDKSELLIIEDSINGIKAGKASGIYTIGLKASKVTQDTSQADKEVYSFEEINI